MNNGDDWLATYVEVIERSQQSSGAFPASPTFDQYNFCWFRDGSFIADAMSRAGKIEAVESFFSWCSNILLARRELILSGKRLDTRYTYDGRDPEGPWGSFQLDGYGLWLWSMRGHSIRHQRSIDQYQEAAGLAQHYLASHWQEPSIDWWEEREGLHAASLACVYAGLDAYGHPSANDVKSAIKLDGERTDASLLICPLLGAIEYEAFAPFLEKIETELVSPFGGVYRYTDDTYYGGGEWPVLTGLLGWYYTKLGRTAEAKAKLGWIRNSAQDNLIPEQLSDHLLHPEQYQYWVDKWGLPATPLLWSHAMLITLANELR